MKQDVMCLSVIIAAFASILIAAIATTPLTKTATCILDSVLVQTSSEKEGNFTHATTTVTVIDSVAFNEVVLISEPPPQAPDLWKSTANFVSYRTGAEFECSFYTYRPRGYKTVVEIDGMPNVSPNVYQRDQSYINIISHIKGAAIIAIGAYVVILVNVLYGVPLVSGFNLLYHKLEPENPQYAGQRTTI
jgi:hypothetical protein